MTGISKALSIECAAAVSHSIVGPNLGYMSALLSAIYKNFNELPQDINFGFSTKVGSAYSENINQIIFELPRWDTNDFWDKNWNRPRFPK